MNQAPPSTTILVLCEGNHCRSPSAEALLRQQLGDRFRVESAGLGARDGVPAHREAARVMAARGLDISAHLSRQLTPAMALGADLILVMDQFQKDWCEAEVPSARGRVFLLGHWQQPDPLEIEDPFQLGPEAFLTAYQAINQCVAGWIPHLLPEQRPA